MEATRVSSSFPRHLPLWATIEKRIKKSEKEFWRECLRWVTIIIFTNFL